MQCPKCKLELRISHSEFDGDDIKQDLMCVNPRCDNYEKVVKHRQITVTDPVKKQD